MNQRYTVRGRGSFPIDMLRYDCAFPATEVDAGIIERSFAPRGKMKTRTILLESALKREPTCERWLSFGWGVSR